MYTRNSVIEVQPFTRQRDGEEIVIGRPEIGTFLAVSPDVVDVLDHLAQGKRLGEVADLSHVEVSDLGELLESMEANGLVRPLLSDGSGAPAPSKHPPLMRYHFSGFPQSLARRIYSVPVLAASLLCVVSALALLFSNSWLWPHGRDLYFTAHRTLIWTLLVFVSYGSVVIHESAHVIATRAQGVNSRLGFGHRLWDLVVEADLSGLWSVPKRHRYLPLLAGTLLDSVITSFLVFFLFAAGKHWITVSPLKLQVLKAIEFTYMTRVFWQWFLFVRTDYYYVIATFFNCKNLLGDTEDFLRNQFARFIPRLRRVDQSVIPSSEHWVIRAYSVVWVVGRIVALTFFSVVTIPLGSRYFGNVGHAIHIGYSANPSDFVDSVLMCFYFIVPIALGLPIWLTSVFRRTRENFSPAAA